MCLAIPKMEYYPFMVYFEPGLSDFWREPTIRVIAERQTSSDPQTNDSLVGCCACSIAIYVCFSLRAGAREPFDRALDFDPKRASMFWRLFCFC